MSQALTENASPVAPIPLAHHVQEALDAYRAGDPDAVPTVRIRAAYRNLSCSGSGPECYRRIRYPGQTAEQWPDSDRLPPAGFRAADRRCTVYAEVPIGTLIADYEREVYRGRRGRCTYTPGLVCRTPDGSAHIEWLEHRTLRARPVYEVALPDGSTVDVGRRR
jgi:hypothetical protein